MFLKQLLADSAVVYTRQTDVMFRRSHIELFNNFYIRLFLTMNPSHGEISRAMRNRGIEICILPEVCKYAKVMLLS